MLIYKANDSNCLNVTCHNQIGSHPFHRTNACYIKQIERPLEHNEELVFQVSYTTPDQIKTLDISTSKDGPPIDRIPVEAFRWFNHLESLRVNSNVATISASNLKLATNLTELVVSDQLQTIRRDTFPTNNRLTFLSFESNRIASIEDFAFERLNRLFSLKLQRNQLDTIKRHTFSGLGVLFFLNLNQNKIRVIEIRAFEELSQLQFLHLQYNQLETLYDSVFHGLRSLIDISLGNNQIQRINQSLKYLNNIKKIDLNYNQISDLDLNEFAKFPHLVDLRLINSGFSFDRTVQNFTEAIATMSRLKYLYLDGNNLSNPLDLQILAIFTELKELSLDDNLYENFDLDGKTVKQILPKLTFLSLEGNYIDQSVLSEIIRELNAPTTTINPM